MPRLAALRPLTVGQFHRRALMKAYSYSSWSHSDIAKKRSKLLGAFTHDKAWEVLRSGRVWEDYFRPASSGEEQYTILQKRCAGILLEIDKLRDSMEVPVSQLARNMVKECSHQSVEIENGTMPYAATLKVSERLKSDFAGRGLELSQWSAGEMANLPLPDVSDLADEESSARWIIELRNNLVAPEWVLGTAHQHPGSRGLLEREVLKLAALLLRDLPVDPLQSPSTPGAAPEILRRFTVYVGTTPTRIFPYPDELPALLARFFAWRASVHEEGKLHPLLLACRIAVYFVSVHPFPDGNGRMSRLLMLNYLVRQGYLPILYESLDRLRYMKMIADADAGISGDLVESVVNAQLKVFRSQGNVRHRRCYLVLEGGFTIPDHDHEQRLSSLCPHECK